MTPLPQFFAAALSAPTAGGASATSRALYGWSCRWVLKVALDREADEQHQLTTGIFTKATAKRFFAAVEKRRLTFPDQAGQARWVRSAYSIHRQAMALFSERTTEALQGAPWRVSFPDLSEWRAGRKLFARAVPASPAPALPDDQTLRRTFRAWLALARSDYVTIPDSRRAGPLSELDRRNLFICVGLELSCGLRLGETVQARWEWWQKHHSRPVLMTDNVKVKNRSGCLEIVPIDPFWRILNREVDRLGWRQPAGYCLAERARAPVAAGNLRYASGGHCDRTFWPGRLTSDWLRALGWRTPKTNHALRDFTASMITMRYGLAEAKDWCRHASIVTTERHYNRFVSLSKRLNPQKLAWIRWAK